MAITWTASASDSSASDAQQPWVDVDTDVFAHFGSTAAIVATYDAGTDSFSIASATPPTWDPYVGSFAGVSRLADGRIFISGGSDLDATYIGTYAASDFTWVSSTALPVPMASHAQTILPDGRLFVLGMNSAFDGVAQFGTVSGDSVSWASATGAPLDAPANGNGASATVLPDGRVLVVFGAYEMAFATISGVAVTWDAASVSGGTLNPDASLQTAAVQWDGSVLIGGGYDGINSYTPPQEYMNTVASAAISGTTVTLTDFDPLPTAYPEVGVRFFRLSDGNLLATCTNLDTPQDELALGADTDPPPEGTPYPAALASAGTSTAAFDGAAVAYTYGTWSAGSSTAEWITDDRDLHIDGGSSAAFNAPTYVVATMAGSSSAGFQSSHKVPTALYWSSKPKANFAASFEKLATFKSYGNAAVKFVSSPTAPAAMSVACSGLATFKGASTATASISVSAAGQAAFDSQQEAGVAMSASCSAFADFLSAVFNGGNMGIAGVSSADFAGDYSTATLAPQIDADEILHVHTAPQQISIEEFA